MAAYARCTTQWSGGSASEEAEQSSDGAAAAAAAAAGATEARDWSGEQELTVIFEHGCPGAANLLPSAASPSLDRDRRFADPSLDLDGGEVRLRRLSTRLRLPRRLLHEPSPPPPPPPSAAVSVVRRQPAEPGTMRLVLQDATVPLDTFAAALQLLGGDGGGGGGGGDQSNGRSSVIHGQELAAELAPRRWQELFSS